MANPKIGTSITINPKLYEQIKSHAQNDNDGNISKTICEMLEDSIAYFEPKIDALTKANEVLVEQERAQTVEIKRLNKGIEELSLENERLTAKIDELTEIETEQTKTIKDLTKAVETLSRQMEELTNAHDEKSRTLDDLTTKHVNLRLTPEQMEALNALIEYRAQYERSQEHDEFAETPEEFVYVYLSDGIAGRNWKPEEYDYSDLFPTLELHLERLGIEKSNETPNDKASNEMPEGQDENDDAENDDENDFEDEGPNDE